METRARIDSPPTWRRSRLAWSSASRPAPFLCELHVRRPAPNDVADLLPAAHVVAHVLIRSRLHADCGEPGATPLELNVWPRAESIGVLATRSGEPDHAILD